MNTQRNGVGAADKLFFHPPAEDPNKEPSWIESVLIGKGSNLALAIVCRLVGASRSCLIILLRGLPDSGKRARSTCMSPHHLWSSSPNCCSKMCVPIKIPVAMAVTPYVHR